MSSCFSTKTLTFHSWVVVALWINQISGSDGLFYASKKDLAKGAKVLNSQLSLLTLMVKLLQPS